MLPRPVLSAFNNGSSSSLVYRHFYFFIVASRILFAGVSPPPTKGTDHAVLTSDLLSLYIPVFKLHYLLRYFFVSSFVSFFLRQLRKTSVPIAAVEFLEVIPAISFHAFHGFLCIVVVKRTLPRFLLLQIRTACLLVLLVFVTFPRVFYLGSPPPAHIPRPPVVSFVFHHTMYHHPNTLMSDCLLLSVKHFLGCSSIKEDMLDECAGCLTTTVFSPHGPASARAAT